LNDSQPGKPEMCLFANKVFRDFEYLVKKETEHEWCSVYQR
jgi:hypothetical protein